MHESFPTGLNPEGESLVLESAKRLLEELNEASDGENTDIGGAQALVREAAQMQSELGGITGAGAEVAEMIKKLHDATIHLSHAIQQVH